MNDVKELETGVDLSDTTGRCFKKKPAINVIPKEELDKRYAEVFELLWKTLSKSFGPHGAPTLIVNYPSQHITKDGYTIMKNLAMDVSETLVDQSIADMAADICGRLNYAVGDGTTTAVIATYSIYQQYMKHRKFFQENGILPRDIISSFKVIKDMIVEKLKKRVQSIQYENPKDLEQAIYDIVYVSSNGDKLISKYIADLYRELMYPAVSCEIATDGVTKKTMIKGYQLDMMLNDRIYINSDNDTLEITNADIVIFATKITKAVYEKILKPLNEECKRRGRHLIVAAPYYDENALFQVIRVDLNNEYKKNHDVNMVLTTYKATSAHARKIIEDFAVLANTFVIDKQLERRIFEELDNGTSIFSIFNIDSRDDIPNINSMVINYETGNGRLVHSGEIPHPSLGFVKPNLIEGNIRLGFIREGSLGLKTSLFKEFVYDEKRYDAVCKEAKTTLNEKIERYKRLGTFNIEVALAKQRVYALNLKMGMIEVGADSELSQKMLKDSVDDAIRAAESAFNNGIVRGCNIDLLQSIEELMSDEIIVHNPVMSKLLDILYDGFKTVYKTVLSNAFPDREIITLKDTTGSNIEDSELETIAKTPFVNNSTIAQTLGGVFEDVLTNHYNAIIFNETGGKINLHDLIIQLSIVSEKVFDVSTMRFTENVNNSFRTDEETLIATIDLISLLIVGNQMVVTQRHNF